MRFKLHVTSEHGVPQVLCDLARCKERSSPRPCSPASPPTYLPESRPATNTGKSKANASHNL
eukprot:4258606-Prorocentrum_lima.AAC.1